MDNKQYELNGNVTDSGEKMETVFRRFYDAGMTLEEIAKKTEHPKESVEKSLLSHYANFPIITTEQLQNEFDQTMDFISVSTSKSPVLIEIDGRFYVIMKIKEYEKLTGKIIRIENDELVEFRDR